MQTSDTAVEIVNPVATDELRGWTANLQRTFLNPPNPEELSRRTTAWQRRLTPDRTWGARERGEWVATLATEPRIMTLPAADGTTRDTTVDALTGVTTSATHRRRGLLTTMLRQSLRAAKDRGDAMSILIAAEWPIYGRFGYGPASRAADFDFRPRLRHAAIEPAANGTVRHVDPSEMGKVGPNVFDRARRIRAGQIDRPDFWWQRFLDDKSPEGRHHLALHETDGVPDGFCAWQPNGDFALDGSLAGLMVSDLVAASATAYRNLWAYLGGIDVVDRIVMSHRPVDEPGRWLLGDGRALKETFAGDFMWLRLLDVPAALAARGYRNAGHVVLDVVDPTPDGYAAGRYLLEAGPGGAACVPTSESPDVRLPATVLAAIYLGGYRLRPIAAGGGVEEFTSGAIERVDAMFATSLEPWCATGF